MKHDFNIGPEGWCSYDYEGCIRAGRNIFVLAVWEPTGGVNDSGYIWADQHGWSADTPEMPISVFPFTLRRSWMGTGEGPFNILDAEVSLYLRGDDLKLHGAKAYFWVAGGGATWHLESQPLEIGDGEWPSEPNRFTLEADESLWHRTWTSDPARVRGIEAALTECSQITVQLSGFTSLPAGKIAMDELEIKLT
jgi:hypothetical protein